MGDCIAREVHNVLQPQKLFLSWVDVHALLRYKGNHFKTDWLFMNSAISIWHKVLEYFGMKMAYFGNQLAHLASRRIVTKQDLDLIQRIAGVAEQGRE